MNFKEESRIFKEIEAKRAEEAIIKVKELGYNFEMVYLPNTLPLNKVKFFFIGMEPSFGKWVKTEKEANEQIKKGFVNFLYSKEDFLLHYSITKYLTNDYHITDVSKIAMLVKNADEIRKMIYPLWRKHLVEEIEYFQKNERIIFSIGNTPEKELIKLFPNDKIRKIMHYSPLARKKRKEIPQIFPDEYEKFKNNFNTNEVIELSLKILYNRSMDKELENKIINYGIKKLKVLNESDFQLLFTYKKEFEKYRI